MLGVEIMASQYQKERCCDSGAFCKLHRESKLVVFLSGYYGWSGLSVMKLPWIISSPCKQFFTHFSVSNPNFQISLTHHIGHWCNHCFVLSWAPSLRWLEEYVVSPGKVCYLREGKRTPTNDVTQMWILQTARLTYYTRCTHLCKNSTTLMEITNLWFCKPTREVIGPRRGLNWRLLFSQIDTA